MLESYDLKQGFKHIIHRRQQFIWLCDVCVSSNKWIQMQCLKWIDPTEFEYPVDTQVDLEYPEE